uniref:Sigma-70 family RNA polymerase sigma factor n=1 Tax=Roseihalotalea indica TaxID=2867963 RepID=A0AA49GQ51_9BACT|nr:sigma-70 family RNA polymerase sigma factor [Tunicatimonas sp. TK19036]
MVLLKQEFTRIISQHQGILHKVCRIYRDTTEDQEDLFQEMVYQLWKAYPAYRKEAKVTTWMYKIALSTAVARYRKKRLVTTALTSVEVMEGEATVHPERERLYRAIGTLSEAEKALVTLYLDDYRYEEIAQILGVTTSYVGVKLHRIKEKLTHLLNPHTHES